MFWSVIQLCMLVLPTVARLSFLGWKGSLRVTVLGLALNTAASSCCFCSSFTYKAETDIRFILSDSLYLGIQT